MKLTKLMSVNTVHAGVISEAPPLSHYGLNILNFLLSVVAVIAIIMAVVSGIRYFLASGDEKAMMNAKRSTVAAVIGVTMILGAMVVVNFVASFFAE